MPEQRRTAVREFTDRINPREAFWNRYDKMISEGTTIITYYGAGGVGKTSLMNELMNELDRRNEPNVKYLYHDFINGTDYRTILNNWKKDLAEFGCEFPLFETGDFYLSMKQGKNVDEAQFQSWISKNKWMNQVKNKLALADGFVDNVIPSLNATAAITDITSDMLSIFPGVKSIYKLVGVVDKVMSERERNKKLDEHSAIRDELNRRFSERNPNELSEYLPSLFAQDIYDWEKISNQKLIIFLDTYELLSGAVTDSLSENNLKRDWWLQNDPEGLIFTIPNTLWAIAGRHMMRWTGELAAETEQHLLNALSYEDSNYFLKTAGIENQVLRDGISKLTEGYPLYLDVCVDTYERYLFTNGTEPTIEEFGQNREQIINRLLKYISTSDGTQLMVQQLSLLGTWTDEMARKVIQNFDLNVYLTAKKFSFIQPRLVKLSDKEVEVFQFDRTLQKFMIEYIKNDKTLKMLLDESMETANKYFDNTIEKIDYIDDDEYTFYLKLWSEFIIKLVDNDEQLKDHYEKYLFDWVHNLIEWCQITVAEEILNDFLNKALELNGENSIVYAYFESEIAEIRNTQGKYNEEFNYRQSVYKKISDLFGDENSVTIEAKSKLADAFDELGNYDEALKLKEDVLEYYHKTFGDENDDTMDTKKDLAGILYNSGRYDEARQIYEQVLDFRQKTLENKDPGILEIKTNLALVFSKLGLYEEARKFQEENVKIDKQIYGENHPATIIDMGNLANTLNDLGLNDEALELQEKVLKLRKDILGEEHPDTIDTMQNIAVTFSNLGRYDEALALQKQLMEISIKIRGEKHPRTLDITNNVALSLEDLGKYDEALKIQKKCLEYSKEVLGENHPNTIAAMLNLSIIFTDLRHYEEALDLAEQVLNLREKIFESNHPDVINAMSNLALILGYLKRYEEALSIEKQVVKLRKRVLGDEHPDTINAMSNLAITFGELGSYNEALELQDQILKSYKKILGEEDPKTINAMYNLALTLGYLERYEEALPIQEQVVKLRKKVLGDEHSDTIDAMNNLSVILNNLEQPEKALQIQKQVLKLRKKVLGDEHSDTIDAMNNFALTLDILERHEEALSIQEQVLKLRKKFLGDEHLDTIDAMDNIANTLQELERYEEALPIREQILKLYKKILGDEDSDTIDAMDNLSDLLSELERYEEAVQLDKQILELRKKVLGYEHPDTIDAMRTLAETLNDLNRNEEALSILREALNLSLKVNGEEDESTFCIFSTFAEIFSDLGQYDEVKKYADRVLSLGKKIFEDDEDEIEELNIWYDNLFKNDDDDEEDDDFENENAVIDEDDKNSYGMEDEIDNSKSISLRRGQKFKLSANNLLLICDSQSTSDIELDTSAFMLDNTGKVSTDDDFIFYNNPKHASNCIEYLEDERIEIDLSKIPNDIKKIAITITTDGEKNFSQIANMIVRLIDIKESKELINFNFADDLKAETAVVIGEIYRHKDQWKFNAVGAGFNGGLAKLCEHFGVEIE